MQEHDRRTLFVVGGGTPEQPNRELWNRVAPFYTEIESDVSYSDIHHFPSGIILSGLSDIIRKADNDFIDVLPLCLTEGVIAMQRIPQLILNAQMHGGRKTKAKKIRFLPPLGSTYIFGRLFSKKFRESLLTFASMYGSVPNNVVLALHGSATEQEVMTKFADRLVSLLGNAGLGVPVLEIRYLKQAPFIEPVADNTLIIPVFLSEGKHVLNDIPSMLQIDANEMEKQHIVYMGVGL